MDSHRIQRRTFITAVGSSTLVALAGCAGQSDTQDTDEPESTPTEASPSTPTEEPTPTSDEQETPVDTVSTENVVYAFAPGKISIIDPENATVVTELTDGFDEVDWGDVITSPDNRRMFVNDGSKAQVIVIDTQRQEIETRVEVGPDPVHMYHPRQNELWTHSDEEGAFYVVDMSDLTVTDSIVGALEDTGHGKLAYHEDLGDTGYATNTNDPGIHVVDLVAKEVTDFIETHDEGGTHAKRYNPVSGHLYVEGTRDSRTAVVDPAENTVVDHIEYVGQIFNTPGNDYVVWVHEEQGVNVLDPAKGEFVAEISVEGAPDKMFFHEEGGTVHGFTANTQNSKSAVIDFDRLEIVDEVEVGDILRPEGAHFLHRGGLAADGWFVTPASGDGVVSVVDAAARELHAKVEVAEGVDTVGYVGEFQ
jgi:hypothetical protein